MNDKTNAAQALLQLEPLSDNRFLSCHNQDNQVGSMFGGQLLAQGLAAAGHTVPPWHLHNCNAYFLSPGKLDQPVEYRVELVRDGRRLATRRVTAHQGERLVLDLLCSFQDTVPGPAHQLDNMPAVPPPEALPTESAFMQANARRLPALAVEAFSRPFPIELHLVAPDKVFFDDVHNPRRNYWFRMPSATALTEPGQHACLLAFMSDFRLGAITVAPHLKPTEVERIAIASLNHSLWFHCPVRVDDWLLFVTDCPWTGEGRGLARGSLYDQQGTLVATVVQELVVGIR